MRIASLVLLLALLPWTLNGQAAKYQYPHSFEVSFPGPVSKKLVRTPEGLVIPSFQSLAPDNAWAAIVQTGFAHPDEAANRLKFFNDMIAGVAGRGNRVTEQKVTTVLGRPAMQFAVETDGVSGRGTIVIDEDRFFAIIGLAANDKDHSPIEGFLNSFVILER